MEIVQINDDSAVIKYATGKGDKEEGGEEEGGGEGEMSSMKEGGGDNPGGNPGNYY